MFEPVGDILIQTTTLRDSLHLVNVLMKHSWWSCQDLPQKGPKGNIHPDEGAAGTWEAQNLYLRAIFCSLLLKVL